MKIVPYTKSSLDAFLKTLAAVVCAVRGNDMHSLATKCKSWQNDAQSFVQHYNVAKSYNALVSQFIKSEEDVTEKQIANFVAGLAKKSKKFVSDTAISQEQLNFLNRCRLVLKKDSDSAYKGIMQTVHQFGDSNLTKFYIPQVDIDTTGIADRAKKLSKKFTGTSDIFITIDQAKAWREKNEESYKEFLGLKREINSVYKLELVKFFRNQGKPLMDINDVKKYLTSKGILFNLPEGYKGKLDEQGKLYTSDGVMLQATPSGKVTMNTDYDGDNWYCKASPSGKGIQMYYTVEYRKSANKEKYEKVAQLGEKINHIRDGWRKMYSNPSMVDKAASILLELCYETSSRIGSEKGNTAGEKTYGMSSIRVKHVVIKDSKVIIKFPGKKGVVQTYTIDKQGVWGTRIYNMLKNLCKNKAKDDRVWTVDGTDIKGSRINKILRNLGVPEGVGIHKFRTLQASKLAEQMLKNAPFKRGEAKQGEVEKWIKEAAKSIGEKLGHSSNVGTDKEKVTGTTALGNYIDLQMQADFFSNLGLRLPNYLKGKI